MLDRSGKSLDEKLFPIKEEKLEASTSRHESHNRMGTEKETKSRDSVINSEDGSESLQRAQTERPEFDIEIRDKESKKNKDKIRKTEGVHIKGMRKQGTLTATMRSTTSKGTVTPVVTVRHTDKEDSFFNSFKYTVRLIGNRRMIRLLPEIFWTGISIAYWSGLVATIVARTVPEKPENEQIAASLYALSVLGVGEMLGSIFMGLVVDKISSKFGCLVNMINVVIVWAISFM